MMTSPYITVKVEEYDIIAHGHFQVDSTCSDDVVSENEDS